MTSSSPLSAHLTVFGDIPKGEAIGRNGSKQVMICGFWTRFSGARAYLAVLNKGEQDQDLGERTGIPNHRLIVELLCEVWQMQ